MATVTNNNIIENYENKTVYKHCDTCNQEFNQQDLTQCSGQHNCCELTEHCEDCIIIHECKDRNDEYYCQDCYEQKDESDDESENICEIDAAAIQNLKNKYRDYLSTPEGKHRLQQAIALKKMWKDIRANSNIQIGTQGVNTNIIDKRLRNKVTKISITPIGLNNMCHITSEIFCDDVNNIEKRLGYNITACPCGNLMSYELHSVNKCGNKLYDFTRDFNDETEKYFLELDTNICVKTYTYNFGNEPITINKGCNCPIVWNATNPYTEEEEFYNRIRDVERII